MSRFPSTGRIGVSGNSDNFSTCTGIRPGIVPRYSSAIIRKSHRFFLNYRSVSRDDFFHGCTKRIRGWNKHITLKKMETLRKYRVQPFNYLHQIILLQDLSNDTLLTMPPGSVLIVEDEGLIALHIAEILENEGYRIIGPVCSGIDALHLLKHSQKVDLILMDIKLRGTIDGLETASRVKSHCMIPLIFITAHTSQGMINRMKELHPDGIIHKPFDEKKVVSLVAETMDKHACNILS